MGAVASFIGTVRDVNDAAASKTMTLEHYPGMTEKALAAIVDEARARFDILDALVIHRVGELRPADQIVLVAVTSAHRGEAFDACRFMMDYLKTRAPFWKKEATPDGARWVDARDSDDEAAARWKGARVVSAPGAMAHEPAPHCRHRLGHHVRPRLSARCATARSSPCAVRPLGVQQVHDGRFAERSRSCSATGATSPRRALRAA